MNIAIVLVALIAGLIGWHVAKKVKDFKADLFCLYDREDLHAVLMDVMLILFGFGSVVILAYIEVLATGRYPTASFGLFSIGLFFKLFLESASWLDFKRAFLRAYAGGHKKA